MRPYTPLAQYSYWPSQKKRGTEESILISQVFLFAGFLYKGSTVPEVFKPCSSWGPNRMKDSKDTHGRDFSTKTDVEIYTSG